ncbi:hypothetical protein DPEC_G00377730 [Dallia pectoralis]|nr:hypothetical protein DPEC_G00377730 [Dallia pectoralis]
MDPAGLIPRQEMGASQIHHALSTKELSLANIIRRQQLMTTQPNPLLAPPEPPVPQSREPRVPTLDRCSGELGLCRAF